MSDGSNSGNNDGVDNDDGAILPSGARIVDDGSPNDDSADTPEEPGPNGPKGVSRRKLLTGIGVGAAAVAAAGLGSVWFLRSRDNDTTTASGLQVTNSWADREIKITAPSGACEAPLVAAYELGLFEKAGLNVSLKKTGDGEDVVSAVGSGTYAASNGIFFNYLGPIYNGTPVKLSGGLHFGCLDLYALTDGDIDKVEDLRGKRIGVSDLQGSATNYFSLDLLDAGINSSPDSGEVEWVVLGSQDLLPQALKDGRVDAVAHEGGFLPIIEAVDQGWAKLVSNNNSADRLSRNADQPCCAVVLNQDFVTEDPVTAGKLVSAWSDGSRYVGQHLEEIAEIQADGNYVAGTKEEIIPVLKTLTFDPSPKGLKEVLQPGIEKYIKTGFLPSDTNAATLADQSFVDLGLTF
ncbi:MAG: ABC transporter substrate-binding protein [Corynebacterium sp.]|uniref:ABC transporter substrate-binding protein n=1 Tax=Corynebacterium sp. TaxID=1720 RepID=UPI003F9A467D